MYPIQSLMNLEYALYGNTPVYGNSQIPSMVNNYCMSSPYMNMYAYSAPYNYNNLYMPNYTRPSFTGRSDTQTANTNSMQSVQKDIDKIANYYVNNMSPSETFIGAATGGAAFALINNPRTIAHPINTIKASFNKDLNKMFADATKQGTKLNELWCNSATNDMVREAYFRIHKIKARAEGKLGLFRRKFNETELKELNSVISDLESALKAGNTEKIAEATAKLDHAYVSNGLIPRGWAKAKKLFGFGNGETATVSERLADKTAIQEKSAAALNAIKENSNMTLLQSVKKSCTLKSGIGWVGFQLLFDMKDIKSAFSKDNKTGFKQLGQTAITGAGSAAGWMAGEAIGTWAATKALAAAGTAIAPGVGTAIGALAGVVLGSIGMWLTGKVTKKITGENVGAIVEVQNMKKTPQGQAQLLELTSQQKNIPLDVQQAIRNVATQYSIT